MSNVKPRVKVPKKAEVGEIITIKTLISHPMESGQRKDRSTGELIPRKIINRFTASFNGETVFWTELEPAVSSNPYIEFSVKFPGEGTFRFEWVDDDGTVYDLEKDVKVG